MSAAGVPARASGSPQAEIFATDNTAIITDPADPRLRTHLHRFDRQVRRIVHDNGARTRRSALLDGVFWSSDLQQVTYERSRRFDVDRTDMIELRHIAGLVRKEFHQESVLTFEYLPRTSPRADAVRIEVPGLDVRRLHDGLVADPAARDELFGGSVTMRGQLILVAELADLDVARAFVTRIGGDWNGAAIRYGDREFVG
ncbi:hypothetical protein E1298_47015 [Actinomadura rubrisoli]|uniref:Uncharacterized protein n=2 Tax=Actinomadura rubrisoli TaxID=2530368 RepID=A0A4R4ZJ44_9ACTN|nr:hypothetical protein E1298_47015 [Actinomadura rubrisoli]